MKVGCSVHVELHVDAAYLDSLVAFAGAFLIPVKDRTQDVGLEEADRIWLGQARRRSQDSVWTE